MKKFNNYFLIISIILFAFQAQAQEVKEKQIYQSVDQMPHFVGGESQLKTYLAKHVKYPADALNNKLAGTVSVTFIIDENGGISNVLPGKEVEGDIEHSLVKEAMRVVTNMPKWIPGKEKGKAVSVQYELPVKFTLK